MTFLKRFITWLFNIIPIPQGDHINEWEKAKQEGKAVREELEQLSEKSKEKVE